MIELGGRDKWITIIAAGPKTCRVARLEARPVEVALKVDQERWGELPIVADMDAADPARGL